MPSPWPYPWNKNGNPLAIPPGALRYQISIQKQIETQDSFGGIVTKWVDVLVTRAAISDLGGGKESFQSGQFVSEVTHRVSIHWPGPNVQIYGEQQVVFGTRTFRIQAIENVQERNRVLHLKCLEIKGVQ